MKDGEEINEKIHEDIINFYKQIAEKYKIKFGRITIEIADGNIVLGEFTTKFKPKLNKK